MGHAVTHISAPLRVYAVSLVAQGLADFVYKAVNIFVNYLAPCQYWREPNPLGCDGVEVIKGGGFFLFAGASGGVNFPLEKSFPPADFRTTITPYCLAQTLNTGLLPEGQKNVHIFA